MLLILGLRAQVTVSMSSLLGGSNVEGDSLTLDIVPFNLRIELKQSGPLYFAVVSTKDL